MWNVKLASRIGSALVFLFTILDYFAYREFWGIFLILRIICCSLILGVGFATRFKWARRNFRFHSMLIPLIAAFFISIFIFCTGDPTTFYYAGLNLCIVGTGTLFNRSALTSLGIFIIFIGATAPFLDEVSREDLVIFLGSCLFIVSTVIITVFGTFNHNRSVKEEFESRSQLKTRNKELNQTLVTLKNTETQLYQSEKMAFLGQVSAGIMHEIGNPLNYSNQALYILKMRLKKEGQLEQSGEIIKDIQDGIDRIKGIIANLQEFSHTGKAGGDQFPLYQCVDSALKILSKPIKTSEVEIFKNWDKEVEVVAIKNQITQVASNLIHNSIQAMEGQDRPPRLELICRNNDDRGMAELIVTDNGPGINEDIRDRLFDPFFTTKDPGVGTGLGLSICFRIIEAHRGQITVDSVEGEGTTFTVALPLSGT